ncbi:Kinesin-like protein kif27, partial [Cladochytrium tenue]
MGGFALEAVAKRVASWDLCSNSDNSTESGAVIAWTPTPAPETILRCYIPLKSITSFGGTTLISVHTGYATPGFASFPCRVTEVLHALKSFGYYTAGTAYTYQKEEAESGGVSNGGCGKPSPRKGCHRCDSNTINEGERFCNAGAEFFTEEVSTANSSVEFIFITFGRQQYARWPHMDVGAHPELSTSRRRFGPIHGSLTGPGLEFDGLHQTGLLSSVDDIFSLDSLNGIFVDPEDGSLGGSSCGVPSVASKPTVAGLPWPFLSVWDSIMVVLTLTGHVLMTFMVAFDFFHPLAFVVSYLIDFMFLLDIYLKFHVAYLQGGFWVVFPKEMAVHYLSSRTFLFDILSSIPWDLVALGWLRSPDALYILCLTRLGKMVRAFRIFVFFRLQEQKLHASFGVQILKFASYLLLLEHSTACMWFAIACPRGTAESCYPGSWIAGFGTESSTAMAQVSLLSSDGSSFSVDLATLYIQSLYWT